MAPIHPSPTPADIDALNEQAWQTVFVNLPEAVTLLPHIKKQCEAINYSFGLACYYCLLASHSYLQANYTQALQEAMTAAPIFAQAPFSVWKFRFHLRLVSIYMYLGAFSESIEHGLLAQKIAQELQLERENLQTLISMVKVASPPAKNSCTRAPAH